MNLKIDVDKLLSEEKCFDLANLAVGMPLRWEMIKQKKSVLLFSQREIPIDLGKYTLRWKVLIKEDGLFLSSNIGDYQKIIDGFVRNEIKNQLEVYQILLSYLQK